MKTKTLIIIGILLVSFIVPLGTVEKSYASCAGEVNYDLMLEESELAFIGTVDRLENYDGPQRVTFIIHDVIKGEINTPKYILENSGLVFLENDSVRSSSNSVDYQISKTYKIFVVNGDTYSCSTKEIFQTDYLWQPGPESGKYTSENPVWVNPCDEGYGSSDGVCITLEEMQLLAPPHLEPNQYPKEPLPNSRHEPELTISDEQVQMMQEYCKTGIRHPDMIGMPLCVKNELVCDPDSILRDGICHLVITDFLTSEDHNGMGGFLLIGIPAIITIIIISVIGYKKSKK